MNGYYESDFDEYQRQTQNQNNGGVCIHCTSESGHYDVCPLINRHTAEHRSAFYRPDNVVHPDVIELSLLEDKR